MSTVAYVNGRYLPLHHADAALPIEDRGLQFADSLYEVAAIFNGGLFDWPQHMDRLAEGVSALAFPPPPSAAVITGIADRLVARARLGDGLLYLQLTRGTARRDHGFPAGVRPNLAITVRPFDFRPRIVQQQAGVSAISMADDRWSNCHIKTTNLLAAVRAKQRAREAGAFEAIFIGPDDVVREGGSTNIHMVDKNGAIITHPKGRHILPGIMRDTLLALARSHGIAVVERPFTHAEAIAAPELFLTSTTAPCLPIVTLDGVGIGQGRPGPVTGRLAALMWQEIASQTRWRA